MQATQPQPQRQPSQGESKSAANQPETTQPEAPNSERRSAKGTIPATIELEPHLEELCDMATD